MASRVYGSTKRSICDDIYMDESRHVAHLVPVIAEVPASSTPASTTAQSFCSPQQDLDYVYISVRLTHEASIYIGKYNYTAHRHKHYRGIAASNVKGTAEPRYDPRCRKSSLAAYVTPGKTRLLSSLQSFLLLARSEALVDERQNTCPDGEG